MKKRAHSFLLFLAVLVIGRPAFSCDLVNGIVDFNCDGKLKILFTGDSIVRGIRDPLMNKRSGGYVLRVQKALPGAEIINLGIPGINSQQLLLNFVRAARGSAIAKDLQDVDYIVVEIGTNDYWAGFQPQATVRNISRIKSFLEDYVRSHSGDTPIVMVADVPKTARLVQRYFVTYLGDLLSAPSTAKALNVVIRFDLLGTDILSWDQVHPDGPGYAVMGRLVLRVFKTWLKRKAEELRPGVSLPDPTPAPTAFETVVN